MQNNIIFVINYILFEKQTTLQAQWKWEKITVQSEYVKYVLNTKHTHKLQAPERQEGACYFLSLCVNRTLVCFLFIYEFML